MCGKSATATVYHAEDGDARGVRELMRRTLALLTAALAVGCVGIRARREPVRRSPSRRLDDRQASPRSSSSTRCSGADAAFPTRNGIHFGLCDRGPLRPCNLGRGAIGREAAGRRARAGRASATRTSTSWSSSACPSRRRDTRCSSSSATSSTAALDPLAATAERLYSMCCLVPYSRPRTASFSSGYDCLPAHVRVGEDVEVVAARRGELGDDRAVGAGSEGVQRVGRDRELLARARARARARRPAGVTSPRRQRKVSSLPGVPSNGGCRCSGHVWPG